MSERLRKLTAANDYASTSGRFGFRKLSFYYSVTRSLYMCSSSSDSLVAEGNMPYTETISADSYSTLTGADVTVTMGGVDITDDVYSAGVISIPVVTGDISISVTAVTNNVVLYTPDDDYRSYAIVYSKNKNKYCVLWGPTGYYYRVRYQYNSTTKYMTLSTYTDVRYSGTSTVNSMYATDWLTTVDDALNAIKSESTEYTYYANGHYHNYLQSYYVGNASGKTNAAYNPFTYMNVGGSYFTSFSVIAYSEGYSENYCSAPKVDADEVIMVQRGE